MAITTTGSVVDTIAANGDLSVGDTAAGSLTVDSGSVKSITAAGVGSAGAEARLSVGQPSATGEGTVTVSGAGSVLEVTSGGRSDAGASAQIGREGVGRVTVNSGATLKIVDTVGTAYDYAGGFGNEVLNIGRGAGGDGRLTVDAGHVIVSGTGANMSVGRGGGTGFAEFKNGSTLDMSATIAAADVGVHVGRGSQGTLAFLDSTATITGGGAASTPTEDYGAYVQVGRETGGWGGLTLLRSSLTLSGDSALPGTPGSYAALQVGRDGGTGAMTVMESTVLLTNAPEGANVFVGRNSLNGVTTNGSLLVSASTITADVAGYANFGIGRGTGTTGHVQVGTGAVLTFQGDLGANLQVGTTYNVAGSTGGNGTLTLNSTGGTLIIQSDNAGTFAGAAIGQYGGTGAVNVDGSGSALRLQGAGGSFVNVGYQSEFRQPVAGSAGTGSLTLTNGAQFSMADGTATSGFRIGGGVGTATVEIRSGSVANLDLGDATASTSVAVGSGVAGAGVATLLVSGTGSRLEGAGFVGVGFTGESNTTGGNGRLIVENGGRIVSDGGFHIGTGGRLSGDGGTLEMKTDGWVQIADGGVLGDAGGAIQSLTIIGSLGFGTWHTSLAANARFDIASSGNDLVTIQRAAGSSAPWVALVGATNFDLNVLGGYKFTAGENRAFITSAGNTVGIDPFEFQNSTITINGQHADFSYYLGQFGGGSSFGLVALNSGATGGASTLDFGAASTVSARFVYSAATGTARAYGGALGAGDLVAGGLAVGVDKVLGTSVGDIFDVSQATQVMVLNGLGGNDTLLGRFRQRRAARRCGCGRADGRAWQRPVLFYGGRAGGRRRRHRDGRGYLDERPDPHRRGAVLPACGDVDLGWRADRLRWRQRLHRRQGRRDEPDRGGDVDGRRRRLLAVEHGFEGRSPDQLFRLRQQPGLDEIHRAEQRLGPDDAPVRQL
jgi:hypothetical protein